ncbi:DinB family protein [Labedaea rhizosphaerae]|uniref:Uncharacterized protein DUF664 n=1 Tax=Labedaea rhizosphaerae TaxID=598644 RepID=A0A4R6SI92_LABRH|nr:DinB family protein [Labedaea rhizosphaerae]TDQ01383.1 uncharacterized protein DUF664 [Labedaea rhizosphaerae]
MIEREREWPSADVGVPEAIMAFFRFLHTTCVNKVAGLTEEQARTAPVPTSDVVSPLGLVKHLTAVQRQHFQRHIGGSSLPLLWGAEDTTLDFRVGPQETIESVVAAFDAEWVRSQETLAAADWAATVSVYDRPVRVGRLVVDVLQETARHVGHLDIVRELIDGATGE